MSLCSSSTVRVAEASAVFDDWWREPRKSVSVAIKVHKVPSFDECVVFHSK